MKEGIGGEGLGVECDLVGRHPAEHALGPEWKDTVLILVFKRVPGHRLVLGDVCLLQNLVFEDGLAVDDGDQQENDSGNKVWEKEREPFFLHGVEDKEKPR
jgi:hypothetical protein